MAFRTIRGLPLATGEATESSPDFDRPPVVEVALSISFDPVERLTLADLGALWHTRFRERGFVFTEDHPPVKVVPEEFGPGAAAARSMQVQLSIVPPTTRMWFLNEVGSELVQFQVDWFARNWRKPGPDAPYPRYRQVRRSFEEDLQLFKEFLDDESLGSVLPRTWEVTYVNHIAMDETVDHPLRLEDVLSPLSREWEGRVLTAPEFTRLLQQHVIPGDDDKPIGRVHIAAEPGFKDTRPLIILTMTARGNVPEGSDDVVALLDVGHHYVVNGFVDVTTREAQEMWGKRDG